MEIEAVAAHHLPSHMISLVDASTSVIRPSMIEARHHLFLRMNDIAQYRLDLVAPETMHVQALLELAENWALAPVARPLLIHCWMGISRSPAAAFIIACSLAPQRSEHDLAYHLREIAPSATPNPRLIALADTQLKRQGRMIEAIRAIGRGADAAIGQPFLWEI